MKLSVIMKMLFTLLIPLRNSYPLIRRSQRTAFFGACLILLNIFGLFSGTTVKGQTDKPADLPSTEAKVQPKAKLSQAELEAQFKATLTKVTLSGRWSSTDNGKLGPEKEDSYEIVSVSKVEGDKWIITAHMKYGKMDLNLPIPVQVKWADDTAVIMVKDLSMGMPYSYSARVMVFDKTYCGTWTSSKGPGGLLYGMITNEKPPVNKALPVQKE